VSVYVYMIKGYLAYTNLQTGLVHVAPYSPQPQLQLYNALLLLWVSRRTTINIPDQVRPY
jgi:hypothetical protein